MAFSLPSFNIVVNWWVPGNTPFANPPSVTNMPAQLYWYSRGSWDTTPTVPTEWYPSVFIRLANTSPVGTVGPAVGGIFSFQPTFGPVRYYAVTWWDFIHPGFGNEYMSFMVRQCDQMGVSPDAGR